MINTLAFVSGLICAAAYLASIGKLGSYLKERHFEVWQVLGEPGHVFKNSIATSRKLYLFVVKNEYKSVGDKELDSICLRVKIFMFSSFGALFYLQVGLLIKSFE